MPDVMFVRLLIPLLSPALVLLLLVPHISSYTDSNLLTVTPVYPQETGTHPDIVVLRWPDSKTYYPAHDLPTGSEGDNELNEYDVIEGPTTTTESASFYPQATTDHMEKRQDLLNFVNLVVPQSPDPVNPEQAPLPPHPYYRDLPSPSSTEDDDDKKDPETEWKKMREKLRLKPVNHNMFKTSGKHVPTLPYAPTQPFYELQHGIDQIRRAVHKMHPMAGLANDVFKKFNMAVKVIDFLLMAISALFSHTWCTHINTGPHQEHARTLWLLLSAGILRPHLRAGRQPQSLGTETRLPPS